MALLLQGGLGSIPEEAKQSEYRGFLIMITGGGIMILVQVNVRNRLMKGIRFFFTLRVFSHLTQSRVFPPLTLQYKDFHALVYQKSVYEICSGKYGPSSATPSSSPSTMKQ